MFGLLVEFDRVVCCEVIEWDLMFCIEFVDSRENAILLEEKEKREKEVLSQIIDEADEFKVDFYRRRKVTCEQNIVTNREKEKVKSVHIYIWLLRLIIRFYVVLYLLCYFALESQDYITV